MSRPMPSKYGYEPPEWVQAYARLIKKCRIFNWAENKKVIN